MRVDSAILRRRPVLAWAFYDWANSAFATTVMAGFFPVFFKQYWNAGVVATESTFRLGVTSGTGEHASSRCWRRCSGRSRIAAVHA